MRPSELLATYVGGPTVLLELHGLRILTDPTFDPEGTQYATSLYTLRKLHGPAVKRDTIGPIDLVLLSHDHHFDNLDHSGRELLAQVPLVLTTVDGATRLGPPAVGLKPWDSVVIPGKTVSRSASRPRRHGTGPRPAIAVP
jgi:Predicted Zn-dependent hydrolases of the beta-lactamase fold